MITIDTLKQLKHKWMDVAMPDGSRWRVPVAVIALDHAAFYAKAFGGDGERALAEMTVLDFNEDPLNIVDWAENDMNWADVKSVAVELPRKTSKADYQDGWVNGLKAFPRVRKARRDAGTGE